MRPRLRDLYLCGIHATSDTHFEHLFAKEGAGSPKLISLNNGGAAVVGSLMLPHLDCARGCVCPSKERCARSMGVAALPIMSAFNGKWRSIASPVSLISELGSAVMR